MFGSLSIECYNETANRFFLMMMIMMMAMMRTIASTSATKTDGTIIFQSGGSFGTGTGPSAGTASTPRKLNPALENRACAAEL